MTYPHHRKTRLLLGLCATLPLLATLPGCGGDDATPKTFPALNYTYLGQLHLNVARIDQVDLAPAGSTPGDLSAQAPTPPDQALSRMAQQRLVASGGSGSATFTITSANITRGQDGALHGVMAVHIDILTPDGQHAGYAQAQVSRTMNTGTPGDDVSQQTLYDLTSQMMQDMNVELEFQVRRSLKDWLVDAGGAPIEGAIQQQSLDTPGAQTTPPAPATPPAQPAPAAPPAQPTPAAAPQIPDAIFPTGGDTPAPQQKSPQPGTLHLPGQH